MAELAFQFPLNPKMGPEEVRARILEEATVALYRRGGVSFGFCAQVAGMSVADYISLLGEHQIGIFDSMDEEELNRDFEAVQEYYTLCHPSDDPTA